VSRSQSSLAALTLGAIGVVYGDIGTSVLYAIKEVFGSGHVPFTHDNVYGILSIVFWTLTVIVSLKYVLLVLRADNGGEGGLIAMLALASQAVKDKPRLRSGCWWSSASSAPPSSMATASSRRPSRCCRRWRAWRWSRRTSSATWCRSRWWCCLRCSSCKSAAPAASASFFGPITVVWFLTIAALGVPHIVGHPEILLAISPHHALRFIWSSSRAPPSSSWARWCWCVTGGEALYADMGHFGKKPIRIAWFGLVMPALTLNYFGQGALLLDDPTAVKNPFFNMAPDWAAAAAGGAGHHGHGDRLAGADHRGLQRHQTGHAARLPAAPAHPPHQRARHRADLHPLRQLGAVRRHRAGGGDVQVLSNLAAAYGIAVTLDMLITTVLTFFVIRYGWGYPLWLCVAATGAFFVVDLAFFAPTCSSCSTAAGSR
jgi:KUP system potassium uptake protein